MDIPTFSELVIGNPAVLFVVGLIFGYWLRMFQSNYRFKKPKRYQQVRVDLTVKPAVMAEKLKEPSFEWSDTVVQTFTKRPLNTIQIDQSRKA